MKKEKILHAIAEVDKLAETYKNEASHFDGLGRPEDARHRRAQASGMFIAVERLKELLELDTNILSPGDIMRKVYKQTIQEVQNSR